MTEFVNHNPNQEYVCFLYKKENNKVEARKFYGEEAAEKAIDKGWYTTPSVFANEYKGQLKDHELEGVKLGADTMATDMNILANASISDDEADLRNAYRRVTGEDIDKRVKKLKAVVKACLKLAGE